MHLMINSTKIVFDYDGVDDRGGCSDGFTRKSAY